MIPFKELNLTVWQVECPTWLIYTKMTMNSYDQFHNFVLVTAYDILVFYFVSKTGAVDDDYSDLLSTNEYNSQQQKDDDFIRYVPN